MFCCSFHFPLRKILENYEGVKSVFSVRFWKILKHRSIFEVYALRDDLHNGAACWMQVAGLGTKKTSAGDRQVFCEKRFAKVERSPEISTQEAPLEILESKVEKDGEIKKDWNSRDMLWLLWFQSMPAKFTDHEITHGCKVSSFEDATIIYLKQGSVAEDTLGLQLHHMFWILSHIDIKLYNRCSSLCCMCFFVSPSRFGIFSVLQMAAPGWSIQRRKTKVPDRFWSEHLFFHMFEANDFTQRSNWSKCCTTLFLGKFRQILQI